MRLARPRHAALTRLALSLAPALGGCAKQSFDALIPVDDTFPRAQPSAEALARYEAAATWSERRDGLALMVLEGGAVVFESYARGYDAATPVHIFSGTKSFSCAIAALAEADGLLRLDEPVADTLPALAAGGDVTVRELLQFTSGIQQDNRVLTRDWLRERQRVQDKYAYAVALPAVAAAGARWEYGASHLTVFGALIKQKTGGSPLDYLEDRLLGPLGLETSGWLVDPDGNPALAMGAFTTANEWAKYGQLLLDDGVWQGERLLPEGAVAGCTQGSAQNPAYGMTFWLNHEAPDDVDLSAFPSLAEHGPVIDPDGPEDLFAAAGYKDNRLYVIPSQDRVIVRLGDGSRRFSDPELLELLLP